MGKITKIQALYSRFSPNVSLDGQPCLQAGDFPAPKRSVPSSKIYNRAEFGFRIQDFWAFGWKNSPFSLYPTLHQVATSNMSDSDVLLSRCLCVTGSNFPERTNNTLQMSLMSGLGVSQENPQAFLLMRASGVASGDLVVANPMSGFSWCWY